MEQRGEADLSLATLLVEVVAAKSALWVGPQGMQGASMLAERGLQITAYLPKTSPRWRAKSPRQDGASQRGKVSGGRREGQLRIRRFDDAPFSSKRKVDLIVVPDLSVFGEEGERRLDELGALLDERGVLACGPLGPKP